MSQLDSDSDGDREELDSATELGAAVASASPAAVLSPAPVGRSTSQGIMHGGSLLKELPAGVSDSNVRAPRSPRHVGFQYLTQLLLTGGPLVILDLAVLAGVIALSRELVMFFGGTPNLDLSSCFLPIATGFLLISAELGLYPGVRLSPVEEFRRLSMAVLSIFAVWIVAVTMLSGGLSVQRVVYLTTAYVMYAAALPICRGAMRRILSNRRWWGFPALVCGHDSNAVKVHDWLANNRRLGLRPVGVIADREDLEIDGDEPWYAGPWSVTPEIAKERGAYWAVVVPQESGAAALSASIAEYLNTLPHVHILSEFTGMPDHWARQQQLDGLTGIHLQQNLMLPLPRLTKRIMDLVAALIGGIILMPLLFYIAVAVKLSSRGPILYSHDRIGKDGRHFQAWKFRSMFQDAGAVMEHYLEVHPDLKDEWERDHKLRYDPRITRIGRFIRKTSLDELPQLWNVIVGDMSLVGPRPIVTAEIPKYGPYYSLYIMVTPGITGLWQVSGRNNTTYDERVQLDSYYVRNWSPWMDLYLLLRTVRIVLFAEGAY